MIGWLRIAPGRHSLITHSQCSCQDLPAADAPEVTALGICTDCGAQVTRISAQTETTATGVVWTVDTWTAGHWQQVATGRARTIATAKRQADAAVERIILPPDHRNPPRPRAPDRARHELPTQSGHRRPTHQLVRGSDVGA